MYVLSAILATLAAGQVANGPALGDALDAGIGRVGRIAVHGLVPSWSRGGGGRRLQSFPPFVNTGNPVKHTPKIYFLWYGSWSTLSPNTMAILTDFGNSITQTPWWNIQTTYYDSTGNCTNAIPYGGAATDTGYSQGKILSINKVANAVYRAQQLGTLPYDTNAIFLLLASPDVTHPGTTGFCTTMCGYHSYYTLSTVPYLFGFIGATSQCPANCSVQQTPNGDVNADGMASVIAHELAESTTDPLLNAYIDGNGYECADRCVWTFGTTYTAPNGQNANVHWGARDYLIQQDWVNWGLSSGCALSWGSLAPSVTTSPSATATTSAASTTSASKTATPSSAATQSGSSTSSLSTTPTPSSDATLSSSSTSSASTTSTAASTTSSSPSVSTSVGSSVTGTASLSSAATTTPSGSGTPPPSGTPTPSSALTQSPTASPSSPITQTPTQSPAVTPTAASTQTPTGARTQSPTLSPSLSGTPAATPSKTRTASRSSTASRSASRSPSRSTKSRTASKTR